MRTGVGELLEFHHDGSFRIGCTPKLVPTPGQYLLAHASASDATVAVAVFYSDAAADGFRAAPPLPESWKIGQSLNLKGPLGHGFSLPAVSQRIALLTVDVSPARLHGVLSLGLRQNSEVVLICNGIESNLPVAVEVQPVSSLRETVHWADFIAMDVEREKLDKLSSMVEEVKHLPAVREAQILIRTPMSCGGLGECGVCAVSLQRKWKLTCREGPVFRLGDLLG